MSTTRIVAQRPWLEIGCTLGEGPIYDPETSVLHFVDISDQKIYHVNTENLNWEVEHVEVPVSCLVFRKNNQGLACAAAEGFALLESNGTLQYLCRPLSGEETRFTRFNDGGCDSKGRFFAGTIWSKEQGIPGRLYKYDPSAGICTVADEGPFTDSNGLGWSPDEKTFYFTDSLTNKIYAYDYEDGNLSNRRVFIDAVALGLSEDSFCDGLCVDREGCVWSARWGGSQIVRFNKEGKIDAEIVFPTALNVTSCCFGGPDDDQLFVTTAHCGANGGDALRQEKYPDSGHLFRINLAGKYKGGRRYKFNA